MPAPVGTGHLPRHVFLEKIEIEKRKKHTVYNALMELSPS
jgi:hypothetical protein